MKTLRKRWFFSSLVLAAVLGLSACAGPQVADYAAEKPVLDLRQYFNGTIDAYGLFTDRSGRVVKRFTVVMKCSWQGPPGQEVGVLDEEFSYSDGSRQRRIWTLKRQPDGRYSGTAADVVGQAPAGIVVSTSSRPSSTCPAPKPVLTGSSPPKARTPATFSPIKPRLT